ncbi:MAG: two-component system response regulator [Bryobacteraceae bacterium]
MDSSRAPILLLVPSDTRRRALVRMLAPWEIVEASAYTEAVEILYTCRISVVICDIEIENGDWQALLAKLQQHPVPPSLVVSSRLADERLWGEVLNLGGYDVLAQPFDEAEVRRVAHMAWAAWIDRREGRTDGNRQRSAAAH